MCSTQSWKIIVSHKQESWKQEAFDRERFITVRIYKNKNGDLTGFVKMNKQLRSNALLKLLPGPAIVIGSKYDDLIKNYQTNITEKDTSFTEIEIGTLLNRSQRTTIGKMCKKAGLSFPDGTEKIMSETRQRNLRAITEFSKGETILNVLKENPEMITDDLLRLKKLSNILTTEQRREELQEEAEEHVLNEWQTFVNETIQEPKAHDRAIYVILDRQGGQGKTYLAMHYVDLYPNKAVYLNNAKKADMLHILAKYEDPHIISIDLTRSSIDRIQYDAIEMAKNGIFNDTKYDSQLIRYRKKPHILLMTNQQLQWEKLSLDRWQILDLAREKLKWITVAEYENNL